MREIVEGHGCIGCHAIAETRIGPSYQAIAARYALADPRTVEVLVRKILLGGAGNWGLVPMVAHPGLEPAEARRMVRWILEQKAAAESAVAQ